MRQNLLKCTLLLCALIVGEGTCWGDTATFSYSDYKDKGTSGSGSEFTMSKSDVSITNSKFYCGSNASYAQFYANGTTTITPGTGVTITGIELTASSTSYNGFQSSGTISASTGSVSGNTSSTTVTWAGSSTSDFTISNNKQIRWTSIVVTYTKSATPLPSITATSVDLAYDATAGSINPTINNAVNGGVLSAAITAGNEGSWLSLGAVSTTVPLICSANGTSAARSATVTLTYTYDINKTVTKDVTVTQAANPNVFDNISSITAVGTTYAVKGTVVAINSKGLVIGDGTGYVYYYKGNAVTQSVGNKITISGTTGTYGHIIQFTSTATVAEAATSNYNNTPAITTVDATAIATYETDYQLSDYVQFEGVLTKNEKYYNIAVGTATARISYPTNEQSAVLDNLLNKKVRVKGYFTGYAGAFTVMMESVEEIVTPVLVSSQNTLSGFTYVEGNGPSEYKTLSVSGLNLKGDITLSLGVSSNYEISLNETSGYTNTLNLNPTTGTVAATTVYVRLKAGLAINESYDGTITLTSIDADNVCVTLSGSVTQTNYTFDLSTDQTTTATESEMTWVNAIATIAVAKGTATTNTNNYYPGTPEQTYTSTRLYKNSLLTITPAAGCTITSVIFTATTAGYANALDGSTLNNVSSAVDGTTVTFTPANGASAFSAIIGGTCGFTSIKVYYTGLDVATVRIKDADYTTFVSDKKLDFTNTGIKAYTAQYDGSKVKLTEIKKVPANTPVIVYKDVKAAGTFVVPVTTEEADAVGTNDLLVSDGTVTGGAGIYALANKDNGVGFYLVKNTVTIPVGKCYLNTGATTTKEFYPFDFDDATAITEVNGEGVKVNGAVYDLSGRQVQKPSKGIYLINGKKVAIK